MKQQAKIEVTEIKKDRLIVTDGISGGTFAIAKYEDSGGVYFYDEKLDKRYAEDRMRPAEKTKHEAKRNY